MAGPWAMPWISAPGCGRPDGCPWDREQTHASLRKHLLEEAYEVYDALEAGATPELAGELGDLWLQVVLHAQLAAEAGVFDLADVQAAIATKIVRRHPHVFGDAEARTASRREPPVGADQGRRTGRSRRRRRTASPTSRPAAGRRAPSTGSRPSMPALAASQEMQERAANLGYDWPSIDGVLDKVDRGGRRAARGRRRRRPGGLGRGVRRPAVRARQRRAQARASRPRPPSGRPTPSSGAGSAAWSGRPPSAASRCAISTSPRSMRCGMPPRRRRGHVMTIGNRPPSVRDDGRGPRDLRPDQLPARRPEVGRGVVPREGRRHPGPVRGDDRRPRPAASSRQGHRLGHRRVLDAAAGHRRAHRPRIGQGPDRRADARDPAPHRAVAARRRRPRPARRADDHGRLRRPPGRRRDADGVDHRRLRGARRRPSSRTGWSACCVAKVAAVSVGIVNGLATSTSTTREDSRAEVDFNVVGTDAGDLRRAPGHGRGQAVRPGRRESACSTSPTRGWRACSRPRPTVLATVRR